MGARHDGRAARCAGVIEEATIPCRADLTLEVICQKARKIEGIRAMAARNRDPGKVMRLRMFDRYWAVGPPGRMPGVGRKSPFTMRRRRSLTFR